MKRMLSLALAGGLLVLGGAAWAAGDGGATGGVGYTTADGFAAKASFNAKGTPTDAKGRVNVRFDVEGWSFTGDVTCYTQFGNMASFSGTMDTPTTQGDTFRFVVLDAGEPSGEDMIRIQRGSSSLADCTANVPTIRPIEDGNLQVHQI